MTTISIEKSCLDCGHEKNCLLDEQKMSCFEWRDKRLLAMEIAIRALEEISETETRNFGLSKGKADNALSVISRIMSDNGELDFKNTSCRDVCEALDRLKKLEIEKMLRRCVTRAEVEDYTRRLVTYITKVLEAFKGGKETGEMERPTKSEKPETINDWASAVIAHLERDAIFRKEGVRKHCKWFDINNRAAESPAYCLHPDIEYQLSHWGIIRQNIGDGFSCMCRLFELDRDAFIEKGKAL